MISTQMTQFQQNHNSNSSQSTQKIEEYVLILRQRDQHIAQMEEERKRGQ